MTITRCCTVVLPIRQSHLNGGMLTTDRPCTLSRSASGTTSALDSCSQLSKAMLDEI
jgi:hypothetical protein